MREGVTEMSQRIHTIHTISLWICIVIGIIVFGAMAYTIYAHRRSKHPEPADFHEHLGVEIIWTIIPVLILAGLAVPAAKTLIDIEDNSNASMTVLITGSQWKWHYQYLDADIDFYSNLATPRTQINSCLVGVFCTLPDEKGAAKALRESNENYLLEVDKPLVLPTNRKVRFLMTSPSNRTPCLDLSTRRGPKSRNPECIGDSARNSAARTMPTCLLSWMCALKRSSINGSKTNASRKSWPRAKPSPTAKRPGRWRN
jgi:hypothetical protein